MKRLLLAALCALPACDDAPEATAPDAATADAAIIDATPGDADVADATPDMAEAPDMAVDAATPYPVPPAPAAPPACGTLAEGPATLIPGPGVDPALDAKALRYERSHILLTAAPMGLGVDARVADEAGRAAAEAVVEGEAWQVESPVASWTAVSGLYGGLGLAADLMRYATLRDTGAACDAVERARAQALHGLAGMHRAFEITGRPGSVARGILRRDLVGQVPEVTPLFDADGAPLPEPKDNGTWRDDASGQHPDYVWVDSCSRDMILGWATASAVAAEVLRYDATVDPAVLATVQADAAAMIDTLATVQESGYDLEIIDPDGRRTLHGALNEHNVERGLYSDLLLNGFNATMALGIVSAFAHAAETPEAYAFLDALVHDRDLPGIARDNFIGVHLERSTNFSAYHMAFAAGWLATRYLPWAEAREALRAVVLDNLYGPAGFTLRPLGQAMTHYDVVAAAAALGGDAWTLPTGDLDGVDWAGGLATLRGMRPAPRWHDLVEQCDAAEFEAGVCTLSDGQTLACAPEVGRKGTDMCEQPVPIAIRRPSNYEWRSNPFEPNGGGQPLELHSGADFRIAYWIGRWTRLPE